MKLLRRYWGACLIVLMVAVHAAVIGYVRSRVARLDSSESTAVALGSYRFQPTHDLSTVYHFQLHAIVDPATRHRGEERLAKMRLEIREASEQSLREAKATWLKDPTQSQIREKLMDVVQEHLGEPLVQRMLITDWLEVPVQTVGIQITADHDFAAK